MADAPLPVLADDQIKGELVSFVVVIHDLLTFNVTCATTIERARGTLEVDEEQQPGGVAILIR